MVPALVHDTTIDKLVGLQKEGAKRKAQNAPLLKVPFTSELGNVTPVFITPAKWSQEEMVKAAETIVFGTADNAGCNCLSPKVIVMSAEWTQVLLRPPPSPSKHSAAQTAPESPSGCTSSPMSRYRIACMNCMSLHAPHASLVSTR